MSLDDLRNSAATSFEDEISTPTFEEPAARRRLRPSGGKPFLGMTPVQRFVLALMIFILTCVVGTFCLLITESLYLF